jgi:hypothetical protein
LSNSSHLPLSPYSKLEKARHEPAADRIGDAHEHDRQRAGYLLQRPDSEVAVGEDYIWRKRNQLCRIFANAVSIAAGVAIVDLNIAAHRPAKFLERLKERPDAGL